MYGARAAVLDKKVYVAGGKSLKEDAIHQVFVYDINKDQWSQLPPSGQFKGIPCVIGGRLAIIGGALSATKEITNKVSTFDENGQKWTTYYPDLLSPRKRPGVVAHKQHIIVAGGIKYLKPSSIPVVQDDMEILNWTENTTENKTHWRKLFIHLPVPMSSFAPTIADCKLYIVGYWGENMRHNSDAFMISIAEIIRSVDSNEAGVQVQAIAAPEQWTRMTAATHLWTALVPHSSPPVIVGGRNINGIATDNISMYNDSTESWRNIASLSSGRSQVAIATINDNSIIAIGGYTLGGAKAHAVSSCVTTVELGLAEIIKPTIISP